MAGALDSADSTDPTMVRISAWAAHPFSSDMSAIDWLLWLGLVLVGVYLWTRLIRHFAD